tara:strand:- start:7910 stop:9241 length:1332 start_codon:yes stop_codon:yes gene_type:complete
MKNNIKISDYINHKDLKNYFERLFPIPRSILGDGFRKSLDILGEIVDLNKKKVKSGTKVLDWTVPLEWSIKDAYIITPSGKKIANFKKNNLSVVNYSVPVNRTLNLEELKKNLHTLPKQPNAIPYVTSYYKKRWGFCLPFNEYKKLKSGKYKVIIKSKLKNGHLVYSDKLIKGKSKKEILISTYLCHPQMANNELSGPLVWSALYKILKNTGPHEYSYRFLICPENIGSAAFLHYSKKKVKDIIAGFVINCVGYGKEFTYKKSRRGNSISDLAAENVLKNSRTPYKIIDFVPEGSDERQFCSPGFNLPIGLLMRKMFGEYKEYHTSLDNGDLINFDTIISTIKAYYEVLLTIENNFIPFGKIQFGTPQLSKSRVNLYKDIMDFGSEGKGERISTILQILNLADGKLDLLEIANAKNFKLINHINTIKDLLKSGYIKKINKKIQ